MFDRYRQRKLHENAVRYAANGWPVAPLAIPQNGVCPCGGNCLEPHLVGEVVRDGYRAAVVWPEPGRRAALWSPRPRPDRGRRLGASELAAGALRDWTSADLLPGEQSTEMNPSEAGLEVKPAGAGAEAKPRGVDAGEMPGDVGAEEKLGGVKSRGVDAAVPGGVEAGVMRGGVGAEVMPGGGTDVKSRETGVKSGGLDAEVKAVGPTAEVELHGVDAEVKRGESGARMKPGGPAAEVELRGVELGGVEAGVVPGGMGPEVMPGGGTDVKSRGVEAGVKPGGVVMGQVDADVMPGGVAGQWGIALVTEGFDVMELPAEFGAVLNHQLKAGCPTAMAPATRRWMFFVVQGSVAREQVVAAGGQLHSGSEGWVPAPGTWMEETGRIRWLVHPYLTEWRPYQRRDPIDLIFL